MTFLLELLVNTIQIPICHWSCPGCPRARHLRSPRWSSWRSLWGRWCERPVRRLFLASVLPSCYAPRGHLNDNRDNNQLEFLIYRFRATGHKSTLKTQSCYKISFVITDGTGGSVTRKLASWQLLVYGVTANDIRERIKRSEITVHGYHISPRRIKSSPNHSTLMSYITEADFSGIILLSPYHSFRVTVTHLRIRSR